MRRWILVVLSIAWLAGCGEPAAEPVAAPVAEPAPAVVAEPAPPSAPELAPSERSWCWYHEPPERDTGGFDAQALHDHTALHVVGAPRRFVIAREGQALVVRRENRTQLDAPVEPVWTQRYPAGATGAPVIGVRSEDRLFAAAPTADGYVVLAIDPEDGALLWQVSEHRDGAGPVQLDLRGTGAIAVHLRTPTRAYVHELDPATGEPSSRAVFGPEVLRAFEPPAQRSVPLGRPSPEGLRVVREGREGRVFVSDSHRTVLSEEDPFSDRATFTTFDDVVVVVTYCSGSSGAAAYGIERATGRRLWTDSPGSIGSIGHSRYSNDVRAVREGRYAVVYGDESGGEYVGVIDPATGLVGYEVWRR